MDILTLIEKEIANMGAELHHTALKGLGAVTIQTNGKTAVYADTGDLRTMSALASAEAHECGHVATGTVHSLTADQNTVLRQEYRADRYAAHKFLPVRKIKKAIADGYTELWQMAELFGFDERFISRTIDVYRREGKL